MSRRLVVHVGPPKTGSTFLQRALILNQDALRASGFEGFAGQEALRNAASDLIGSWDRNPAALKGSERGAAWTTLQKKVAAVDTNVVISCERFSLLDATQARTFADAFPDHDILVVLTLRDSAALLPSRWQEGVKNGRVESWPEFCEQIVENPTFLARMTRTARTLEAWTAAVGAEKVAVVTVPPRGSKDSLLSRFCSATGIPLDALSGQVPERLNESIGMEGAELLVRVNQRHTIGHQVRRYELKGFVSQELGGRQGLTPPVLGPAAFEVAKKNSLEIIELVRSSGVAVTGDLADLQIVKPPPDDVKLQLSDPEHLDAAADVIAALAQRSNQARQRLARIDGGSVPLASLAHAPWRLRLSRLLGLGETRRDAV